MTNGILRTLERCAAFETVREAAAKGGNAALFGAHPIHRAACAAALADASAGAVIFVTASDREAVAAAADIGALGKRAAVFPSRDLVFLDVEGLSHDAEQARLFVLGNILEGGLDVVCCSAEALCQYTMPRDVYRELSVKIEKGRTVDLADLSRRLVSAGYSRFDRVEGRGQFAVRGGLVDVFPVHLDAPVRIELFGDEIDAVFEYDPETQRRTERVGRVFITPSREVVFRDAAAASAKLGAAARKAPEALRELLARDAANIAAGVVPPCTDRYLNLFYDAPALLTDYLPGAPVFFSEPQAVLARCRSLLETSAAELLSLSKDGMYDKALGRYYADDVQQALAGRARVYSDIFAHTPDVPLAALADLGGSPLPLWSGEFSVLDEDLRDYTGRGFSCVVYLPTMKAASALVADLDAAGYSAALGDSPDGGGVGVAVGSLSSGFEIPSAKLCVFASRREAAAQKKRRKRPADERAIADLEDLRPGDLVVHVNHGIGMFDGIHRIDHHGFVRDYIKIKYRGEDTLYVPVTQLDMVSQYVSPRDPDNVRLAKLNSGEWAKTKQAVYRSVREMAKELIELYAKREQADGVGFPADDEWQRDFEARFPYDETDEQLRAADEIKRDMEKDRPMDRLLCGDVGVGKTEVALRAAFKCVSAGYQCAVLVPTTILAWQHYATFRERLDGFPVRVAMLSRFASAKEQREAVRGIRDGTVDIAIGTHKLLQKNIQFKKLGLLVVDEEQRFGVKHKEMLKQTFAGVDVLTLSATPIPRTLNMAMSGIRDMSVIEEPPQDRYPVATFVIEYDETMVLDAVRRELSRGGQVYFLHNRIDSIEGTAAHLRELLPDAAIDVAHGRMDEEVLSDVWQRLIAHETDILVCTTIIEAGVDVPNCNTLIVEDADRLGLSQLYQIRGRVGRSSRRAYAYFTFRRDRVLTEIAQKRLSAIRDFTSFGSGFRIAMRDLQIRGAGSVLSAKQSGHMEAVGYDTYLRILNEAVDDERGIRRKPAVEECTVDLAVSAYIPEDYIPDSESRIEMYKRVAAIGSESDRADVLAEFLDRFGEPPACVTSLANVSLARVLGKKYGFYEISSPQKDAVLLYSDVIDEAAVRQFIRTNDRRVLLSVKGKAYVTAYCRPGEAPDGAALGFLADYDAMCAESGRADGSRG
ncbi:MAG: transcription-repair coupling factor [Oscillospiraceae bacterium]|nr:transcription-repair coupling factor [Oscillospiraceae bacterium]